MVYVALLRVINVGGKNLINMKQLKEVFKQAGMESVTTYINTGNIIFKDHQHTKEQLVDLLEEAIYLNFGIPIKVAVCSMVDYKKVIDSLPASWTDGRQMKSDVFFLWDEINDSSLLVKLDIKPEIDSVIYVDGAILWSTDRIKATRSGKMKLPGSELYPYMTARNVNTTRKIYEMMESIR